MRRQRSLAGVGVLAAALIGIPMSACGGGTPAKDPTTETKTDDTPKWDSTSETPTTHATSKGTAAAADADGGKAGYDPGSPRGRGDQYDKPATEIPLNRASRQVKDNCGKATDTDGKANGPFGKATLQLTLGHNGHMKDVKVPPAYDGKPAGNCIIKAFSNLIFPPWAGADTTIDWEVEITK